MTLFKNALSEPVRDALATLEPPATLDALVRTAIRIDNRVRERERERSERRNRSLPYVASLPVKPAVLVPPLGSLSYDEPMQIDSSSLRNVQEQRQRSEWCRYCRQKGHIKNECPKLGGNGRPH
uniref:CCHC-type domain-containing protein n=1 Tax=Anguilla anguilla TaxID=7936 RepID=A0A0E9WC51_ANGAN